MEIAAGVSEVIVTIGRGEATVTTLRVSPDEAALLACEMAAAARDARKVRPAPAADAKQPPLHQVR